MAEEESFDDGEFTFNLIAVITCICCGACAAGLTMGLLSLDGLKLKVKTVTGTEAEKRYIGRLLPLLEDHHYLLCTLLIFNAVANEAMPIFLDNLVPSWAAVIVSVTLVLVFGEIVPTATFTGPQQLQIVSTFVPLVYLLQILFYPVARPMGWLLDMWLGHDEDDDYFTRDELAAMVRILRSKGADIPYSDKAEVVSPMMENKNGIPEDDGDSSDNESESSEEPLTGNEVNVITGVLGLSKMTILDIHTDLKEVDMLSDHQVFDDETVRVLVKCGHSRLPVFKGNDRRNIVGVFRTKTLIEKDPEDSLTMDQFKLTLPLVVGAGQSPLTVLNLFQQGHSHIALVSHDPEALLNAIQNGTSPTSSFEPIGIVTLEDVIEAMLQSEIYDEEDMVNQTGQGDASSELFNLSMSASRATSPREQQGEDEDLQPLPEKPPSLLKSLSDSLTAPFSGKRSKQGGSPGKAAPVENKEISKLAAGSGNMPNYNSVEEGGGDAAGVRKGRSNTVGSARRGSANKTFYKQYDGVHDALGEPLIPSQDGAHSRQKMEGQNSRAESNKFGKNLVAQTKSRKITPSLVNKYVTTGKVYKAGDAPDRPRTKSESPRSRSAKV